MNNPSPATEANPPQEPVIELLVDVASPNAPQSPVKALPEAYLAKLDLMTKVHRQIASRVNRRRKVEREAWFILYIPEDPLRDYRQEAIASQGMIP